MKKSQRLCTYPGINTAPKNCSANDRQIGDPAPTSVQKK